jgi:hypothetical protein
VTVIRIAGSLATPVFLAILLGAVAPGCRGCGRATPADAVVDEAALRTPTVWTWVGEAPAWVRVDVEALREDPRARAIWVAAGATASDAPLGEALGSAAEVVVAWRDAAFAERINVVSGYAGAAELGPALAADGFVDYAAGRARVWSHPGHAWAVSTPARGMLVTGVPEAVRAAVSSPCAACEPAASTSRGRPAVRAALRVTDEHRQLASLVLRTRGVDRALASIDSLSADLTLGLGADISVRLVALEGADLSFVGMLLEEVIAALGRVTSAYPDAALAGALLERTHVDLGEREAVLTLEISREELDAIVAVLVAELDARNATLEPEAEAP